MATYSLSYARTHFCALYRRAEAGEEIGITKREVLVAKLSPSSGKLKHG